MHDSHMSLTATLMDSPELQNCYDYYVIIGFPKTSVAHKVAAGARDRTQWQLEVPVCAHSVEYFLPRPTALTEEHARMPQAEKPNCSLASAPPHLPGYKIIPLFFTKLSLNWNAA